MGTVFTLLAVAFAFLIYDWSRSDGCEMRHKIRYWFSYFVFIFMGALALSLTDPLLEFVGVGLTTGVFWLILFMLRCVAINDSLSGCDKKC